MRRAPCSHTRTLATHKATAAGLTENSESAANNKQVGISNGGLVRVSTSLERNFRKTLPKCFGSRLIESLARSAGIAEREPPPRHLHPPPPCSQPISSSPNQPLIHWAHLHLSTLFSTHSQCSRGFRRPFFKRTLGTTVCNAFWRW